MITVASYNIWAQSSPSYLGKKESRTQSQDEIYRAFTRSWNHRKIDIIQNIIHSKADILSLEEVTQEAFDDLREDLARHGYTAFHQLSLHPKKDHGLALFYRKQNVEPIWASFTTIGKQTQAFIGNFQVVNPALESAYNKVIRFASCHLTGGINKKHGDTQLVDLYKKTIIEEETDTVVITGDFNRDEKIADNERLSPFLKKGFQPHDLLCQETEIGTGRHMDWILVKSSDASLEKVDLSNQKIASDHILVATALCFQRAPLQQRDNPNTPWYKKISVFFQNIADLFKRFYESFLLRFKLKKQPPHSK